MGKIKRMDQVKEILQVYLETKSIKGTARRLGISKNTVRDYIRKGEASDKDLLELISLSDEAFLEVFYKEKNREESSRHSVFLSKVDFWIQELRRVGVTKQLLWEEYRMEHKDGYAYSRFCELLRHQIGRRDLTLPMSHPAGEVMQVDFAGKKMSWVDVSSGEVHDCEVLVAVMPHSHYTFAIALPSQKTEDFIAGLNAAFAFFGKIPKKILSDNLKAYVIRSDRYEPTFNDLCVQLSVHYGVDLEATRAGKPKDKASVENMVSTVYRRVYAPLRNEIYHNIEELNTAILTQIKKHNQKPFQKKEGSRSSIFQTYEVPQMRDLPTELFSIKKTRTAKVQRNYHVYLGEEKNYYSVPFRYVGKQATLVYTKKIVEIYIDNQRVAFHRRMNLGLSHQYQTVLEHMPKSHQEWRKSEGYDSGYFLRMGLQIGEATHWAMSQILTSKSHQSQNYKSCLGVLSLGRKHGNERLERVAAQCKAVEKVNYTMLSRMLRHNLDKKETEERENYRPPEHENIRGSQAYH